MREITCINKKDNESLILNDAFSPFLLQDVEGIYMFDVNVYTTENSLNDGSTVVGSVVKPRNIVLTIADKENFVEHRNFLYSMFKPKTNGTLIYKEIDENYEEERKIDYVVEKLEADTTGHTRQIVISLLCPDPFFSAMYDTTIYMSYWDKQFEFIHEFTAEKEEFATRAVQKLVQFENDSSLDKLGIVITMESEGEVVNPRMYHFESDSYIQVGSSSVPFTLEAGEKLIISTVVNDKNVYLVSNGVRTAINEYIEEGSEYIQLTPGENSLRYSAASGEDNMLVEFSYVQKYQGV